MKNNTGLLILIIITALAATNCKKQTIKTQKETGGSDTVAAFVLHKESFYKEIYFPGELIPLERAEIFAKISGYVNRINADIGDVVQKGQVIAILDAPEVIANYAQINSDVQTAKSKYIGSLDAYKRISKAAESKGTVAAGELERMRNQMVADSAALEATKSKLNAYSQLKDYLVIRAPFNGKIIQRNVDPGTLVGTGNTKPMLVIENNRILRLRLAVPEAYTSSNPDSLIVHFTVDAYPGSKFKATLSRKAGSLTQSNRSEIWEFLYNNKDGQLKSGMFANASIGFGRSAKSFLVPSTAIVTNQEKRFVIGLKNHKTIWVDVRNGITAGDKTEIFGNISEGDTLLTRGTDEIKPEMKFVPKFQDLHSLHPDGG